MSDIYSNMRGYDTLMKFRQFHRFLQLIMIFTRYDGNWLFVFLRTYILVSITDKYQHKLILWRLGLVFIILGLTTFTSFDQPISYEVLETDQLFLLVMIAPTIIFLLSLEIFLSEVFNSFSKVHKMVLKLTLETLHVLLKFVQCINLFPICTVRIIHPNGLRELRCRINNRTPKRTLVSQCIFIFINIMAVTRFVVFCKSKDSSISISALFMSAMFTFANAISIPFTIGAAFTHKFPLCQAINSIMTFGTDHLSPKKGFPIPELLVNIFYHILILVMIPVLCLVTFIFPCTQFSSTMLALIWPESCSSLGFQTLAYFLEMALFLPTVTIGGIESILFVTGITVLIKELKKLDRNLKRKLIEDVFRFYQHYQLFVLSLNNHFQALVLPTVQAGDAALIIASLYTVIMGQDEIPSVLYGFVVIFLVSVSIFMIAVLDVASRVQLVSNLILRKLKASCYSKSKYCRKRLRTMPTLRIFMGPFHAVDRARAPALIRFCLQRTVFLIFNSRSR